MSITELDKISSYLEEGDHDRFAHYVVPKAAAVEAYINGTPVAAVCGKIWVPTRLPDDFEICPTCQDIMHKLGANV